MEEILASIRRIISEDETPADGAAPAEDAAAAPAEAEPEPVAAAPEPEPEIEAVPPPAPEPVAAAPPEPDVHILEDDDDDDLELTQKVETHGDLDILAPEPAPTPAPVAALVSDHTAAVAASAFDKLSSSILMPASDRTLEDVVRSMLQPMLKQWLDDNLPGIVQEAVQAEVERIARGRVR